MSNCAKIWVEWVRDEDQQTFSADLPCNQWKCDDCRPKLAAKLRREIREALAAWMNLRNGDPAQFRFWAKFLTLTLPGWEWRAKHAPVEAEKILKDGWRKLRNHLRKHLGEFEFVQVDELQPSGYPHLHVMLLGPGIAGKEVLGMIRSFWVDHLGLGQPDLRVIYDLDATAGYLTKYVSKAKAGNVRKGSRIFSFSKGLKALIESDREERRKPITVTRLGFIRSDGTRGPVLWEAKSALSLPDSLEEKNLKLLLSFFDGKKNGKGDLQFFWDEGL